MQGRSAPSVFARALWRDSAFHRRSHPFLSLLRSFLFGTVKHSNPSFELLAPASCAPPPASLNIHQPLCTTTPVNAWTRSTRIAPYWRLPLPGKGRPSKGGEKLCQFQPPPFPLSAYVHPQHFLSQICHNLIFLQLSLSFTTRVMFTNKFDMIFW